MRDDQHTGPFIQNDNGGGLLRRLLRGGGADPAAPHAHTEPSTSQMHHVETRPTAPPDPFGGPRSPAPRPARTRATDDVGTGGGTSIVGMIFRTLGARGMIFVIIMLVAFGNGIVASVLDERGIDTVDDSVGVEPVPALVPAPAPAPDAGAGARTSGQFTGVVLLADGGRVTLMDTASGRSIDVIVESPQTQVLLRESVGNEVDVTWSKRGTDLYVEAASTSPATGGGSA